MKKNLLVLVVVLMLIMAGCGSKPTLSQFLESDVVATGEEETNSELANAGLKIRVKYSADGEDILVISYIHEEYQSLAGLEQDEIAAKYAKEISSFGTATFTPSLFKACKEDAGITLKCIRVQCVNADGTVIYSQDYYDTNLNQ